MNVVTLLTDFGLKDGNVGVMKGIIWTIAPRAQIADLSHLISPQNVLEAGLILARSAPCFPPDSVHVIVVDPGVGTERRPIAARLGNQRYVAPDNGVLTQVLEQAERAGQEVEIVHLDKPRFWRKEISNVFHGRDIFAPIGGHLAAGMPLVALGSHIHDPIRVPLPTPQSIDHGLRTEVLHIDHFGNVSTSVRLEDLGDVRDLNVRLGGADVPGLYNTFGELPPGELMALIGSTGWLIVSQVNGSAAQHLNVKVGDPVLVQFASEEDGQPTAGTQD